MTKRLVRALHKPLALRGVGMNLLGDVFGPRAHFEGEAETCLQLRNPRANPLNSKAGDVCRPARPPG